MKMDGRLTAVLEEIKYSSRLIDIGADHGKLCVSAVLSGYAERAVAVDISEKSLLKAEALAKDVGVYSKMEFIAMDGADYVWTETDCVVIAGMGGTEILHIIRGKVQPERLVLVAHQDAPVLRRGLNGMRWYAEKDYVVTSGGKYYNVICVSANGEKPFDEKEIVVGKNTPSSEFFIGSLELRLKGIERYYSQAVSEELKREKEIVESVLSFCRN